MENKTTLIVKDNANIRIDRYLARVTDFSRNRIKILSDEGAITVNGKNVGSSYKISLSDIIEIVLPQNKKMDIEYENLNIDIIYEDEDIIVVNKERGMMVHPASGIYTGTLLNALLYHCKDLTGINGVIKPGIVHRLDKDTSGCIVACKNEKSSKIISEQIQSKKCYREYIALVEGEIERNSSIINVPVEVDKYDNKKMIIVKNGGQEAITHFEILKKYSKFTLVKCILKTGRKHQIRLHMSYIGHPIVGDIKYGSTINDMNIKGHMLHASSLKLVHPTTLEKMEFKAEQPKDFICILNTMKEKQ